MRSLCDHLHSTYTQLQLKFDVELPCNILDDEPKADEVKLARLYQQYGFKKWLLELDSAPAPAANSTSIVAPTAQALHVYPLEIVWESNLES